MSKGKSDGAEALAYLIGAVVAIAIYITIIIFVSAVAIYVLFPIGCVAFIGAVLFNYVKVLYEELVVGKGWADSPAGPEPAFKQYFFRKARYDYWEVVKKSALRNWAVLVWLKDWFFKLFQWNYILAFTFPLALGYIAVVAAGTTAGALAYLVFGLLHMAIVATCAGAAIAAAYTLRGVERLQMFIRHRSLKCPYRECHEKIALPYYMCPNPACGERHNKLLPGDYGVVKRQCKCGAWLPTLFLFGRNQLVSYCPSCDRQLNSSMGVSRNVHIPIIAGRSAGKSHYLAAAMMEIHRRADDGGLSVAFPEKQYEADYVQWKRYFESGNTVRPTQLKSPDAFLVNLNSGGEDCLLYVYDPAGELLQQTDTMRSQEFFYYADGIVFLIDPFSIPQVQGRLQKELNAAKLQIGPSEMAPQDAYANLLQTLQQQKVGRRSTKRLAVVLTKTDAINISNEIQQIAARQPPDKGGAQAAESSAVRAWLEKNGEGNLLRGIEGDFKSVSYFYCSPLGRVPDSGATPFVPAGVLKPFGWLLRSIVDFETGTPKPIAQTKTLAAPAYPLIQTPPGETVYGKIIAAMWALSVVSLVGGSLLFALWANTAGSDYAYASDYTTASSNSSGAYDSPRNPLSSSNSNNNAAPYNSNSAAFRSDTSVRNGAAALKKADNTVIYLAADTPLKVIEIRMPWYWVQTRDGAVGWIHGNDIYPLR
jgi:hypothetical protein